MPRLSRRSFVGWLGSLAALAGIGSSRLGAGTPGGTPPKPVALAGSPPAALDPALLDAVAAVVLPAALGAEGQRRHAAAFRRWVAGYRAGVEVVHGYGTTELRSLGPSPETAWRGQLAALDAAARSRHGRGFAALSLRDRDTLVREALAGERGARLPAPLAASHVALALLAQWAQSPDANDMCHDTRIGRQQCRPLVNAAKEPVKLARPTNGARA